jgi:CheY-like chemotaxis protein
MTNPTILVADDDPVWMNSTARLLETEGYRILRARTGVDALYQTLMRRPDLVLLNPDLPQLSGWQVCQRLKRSPGLGSVKVVMLTMQGEAAFRAGADGYLIKGGQVELVLPAIRAFHHPASGILGAFLHRRVIAA